MFIAKNNGRFLLLLFLFSFLLRAFIFGFFLKKNNNYWNYDTAVYNDVAVQIAHGNGIINSSDGSFHFYRVPGYSVLLSHFL